MGLNEPSMTFAIEALTAKIFRTKVGKSPKIACFRTFRALFCVQRPISMWEMHESQKSRQVYMLSYTYFRIMNRS